MEAQDYTITSKDGNLVITFPDLRASSIARAGLLLHGIPAENLGFPSRQEIMDVPVGGKKESEEYKAKKHAVNTIIKKVDAINDSPTVTVKGMKPEYFAEVWAMARGSIDKVLAYATRNSTPLKSPKARYSDSHGKIGLIFESQGVDDNYRTLTNLLRNNGEGVEVHNRSSSHMGNFIEVDVVPGDNALMRLQDVVAKYFSKSGQLGNAVRSESPSASI